MEYIVFHRGAWVTKAVGSSDWKKAYRMSYADAIEYCRARRSGYVSDTLAIPVVVEDMEAIEND